MKFDIVDFFINLFFSPVETIKALKELIQARSGNTAAMISLGKRFQGIMDGVTVDSGVAVEWYRL